MQHSLHYQVRMTEVVALIRHLYVQSWDYLGIISWESAIAERKSPKRPPTLAGWSASRSGRSFECLPARLSASWLMLVVILAHSSASTSCTISNRLDMCPAGVFSEPTVLTPQVFSFRRDAVEQQHICSTLLGLVDLSYAGSAIFGEYSGSKHKALKLRYLRVELKRGLFHEGTQVF